MEEPWMTSLPILIVEEGGEGNEATLGPLKLAINDDVVVDNWNGFVIVVILAIVVGNDDDVEYL